MVEIRPLVKVGKTLSTAGGSCPWSCTHCTGILLHSQWVALCCLPVYCFSLFLQLHVALISMQKQPSLQMSCPPPPSPPARSTKVSPLLQTKHSISCKLERVRHGSYMCGRCLDLKYAGKTVLMIKPWCVTEELMLATSVEPHLHQLSCSML